MKKKSKKVKKQVNMYLPMIIAWVVVLGICVAVYFLSESALGMPNFRMLALILAFATFVMTTLFSFLILNHNITMRKMSEESNKSADEFRELQFVSSNYSVIDFHGDMLLYEQYSTYTDTLRETRDFTFYLRHDHFDMRDVAENLDDYAILSVKLPFRVIEGKRLAGVRITRFRFTRDKVQYKFVPCTSGLNALILHDEGTNNNYVLVNLIIEKDGDFFTRDAVTPFGKIKLNLSMTSLLGVEVGGWSELYFTNPRKLEKDGANMYKITSSQFKISGLPTLVKEVKFDI